MSLKLPNCLAKSSTAIGCFILFSVAVSIASTETLETVVIEREVQQSYIEPRQPAAGGNDAGARLVVHLLAPGRITNITLTKTGPASAYVHDCPDGGNCPGYPRSFLPFDPSHPDTNNHWLWNGWTNSGAQATLHFTVTYVRR